MKKFPINRIAVLIAMFITACPVMADIVVVGSKGLNELSAQEARQIFLKRTQVFADGTPAIPIDLPDEYSVKWQFYQEVTGKDPAELKSYWIRAMYNSIGAQPEQVKSLSELKIRLQKEGAIGYLDAKDVEPGMNILLRIPG